MGELRYYLHHPTPGQRSGDLEEIIDRYGLSRGERRLTIAGEHLQRIQKHILWSRIYQLGAEDPTMRRPGKLHLLANPYGTAIRVCNPDGLVMEGDENCYLGMMPVNKPGKSARVNVVPADPRTPKQPLHYSIAPHNSYPTGSSHPPEGREQAGSSRCSPQ